MCGCSVYTLVVNVRLYVHFMSYFIRGCRLLFTLCVNSGLKMKNYTSQLEAYRDNTTTSMWATNLTRCAVSLSAC